MDKDYFQLALQTFNGDIGMVGKHMMMMEIKFLTKIVCNTSISK